MTQDNSDNAADGSKKSRNGLKGGLVAALTGAVAVSYTRKLLFGKPPKTWRKALTYGAISATILYHKFDIDEKYNAFVDYKEQEVVQKYDALQTDYRELQDDYKRQDQLFQNTLDEMSILRHRHENLRDRCSGY